MGTLPAQGGAQCVGHLHTPSDETLQKQGAVTAWDPGFQGSCGWWEMGEPHPPFQEKLYQVYHDCFTVSAHLPISWAGVPVSRMGP